jgi:hypothetical protein
VSKFRSATFTCLACLAAALLGSCSVQAQGARNPGASAGVPESAGAHTPHVDPYASEVPQSDVINKAGGSALAGDGTEDSIPVAQELDFVTGNSFRTDGGYDENLKKAAKVDYYGTRYVDCEHYSLEIHTARPDQITTSLKAGLSSNFESRRSGSKVVLRGESPGMANEVERALLETFDFDTPVVEIQRGHPAIQPLGMQKLPGLLTWKLQVGSTGEYYRVLYVDSHFGDVVRYKIMSAGGAPVIDVALHDYRAVKGIRVAFAIDYRKPDGTLLASDRLERVEVTGPRS